MSDDDTDRIRRRDEILELLYWLEGESLVGPSTLATMSRFLAREEPELRSTLEALRARGDVLLTGAGGEYRLTQAGRGEAARRFADEFASLLSRRGGECNDPTCDCHTNPAGAAECRAPAGRPGR